MVYHERPGVYADYALSSTVNRGRGSKTVALAAYYSGTGLMTLTSFGQIEELPDGADKAADLIKLLFMNGAGTVLLYPATAETAAGYSAAAKALLSEKKASLMICDSEDQDVQEAIMAAIQAAEAEGNNCIGIMGLSGQTVSSLTARAAALDCERMVLVGGSGTVSWSSETSGGIYGAAALAGVLSGEEDPAMPVSGAELQGLNSAGQRFSETEIDSLVRGGVTVLESLNGTVSVLRAVTTRTTTDGAADASWRELTTILIVDNVIPGVRDALRQRFVRKKNNATTRGAIRCQVALELEDRVRREIIDSYGDITVEADEEDPTICNVSFAFSVAHGLSRIYLTAYITV